MSNQIDKKIDDLFKAIDTSKEYLEYEKALEVLKKNTKLNDLIAEIKTLEKKATKLEYEKNEEYKKIDKIIEEKMLLLKSDKVYSKYLDKQKHFNDILKTVTAMIEEYIDEKTTI